MASEENQSKRIGRRIRAERTAKLIKQEILAKKVSLSKSEISRIENGQRELKVSKLYEIAEAIGISASKLIEDE
ncbi:MAG TPA: helix-turn-helix transcriptional regulator [Chitinophagaceae bacterium]|nr:helix-turn-helix transcriptional regulator [Chitinophagaceae bacterium]